MIGGVCAGLADYFDVDVLLIRVLMLFSFPWTFWPYIIVWFLSPSK